MKHEIIIVAGGTGSRMNSDLPKQFIEIKGKPVIVHTVQKFLDWSADIHVIIVMNPEFLELWERIQKEYFSTNEITTVSGGETRFHSVKNGLAVLKGAKLVGIHDAARPAVSLEVIERCFSKAESKGGAIPVLPVTDSLRKLTDDNHSKALNRKDYVSVQTPQCFRHDVLLSAYEQTFISQFTDDASVVESAGKEVCLVEGNRENIKLTEPSDKSVLKLFL